MFALFFLKRDIYLHGGTCTAFYPTVIASRSIWHYNNGQPRCILLLSGPHTQTYGEKEALAGSRCMSLTVDDLDWESEIIMQYFSQRGTSVSTSLASTAAAHYFATLLSALNDLKWAWDFSSIHCIPKDALETELKCIVSLLWNWCIPDHTHRWYQSIFNPLGVNLYIRKLWLSRVFAGVQLCFT